MTRRRSTSSCCSPGPREPTPPRWRDKWVHKPARRGNMYWSCASSTWILPSRVRARWAKISRINSVRSSTLTFWPRISRQVARLGGRKIVVEDHDVGARLAALSGQFLGFAAADERGRRGRIALLGDEIDDFRAGGLRQFAQFLQGILDGPLVVARSFQSNQQRPLLRRVLRVIHLQRVACSPVEEFPNALRRFPRRFLAPDLDPL